MPYGLLSRDAPPLDAQIGSLRKLILIICTKSFVYPWIVPVLWIIKPASVGVLLVGSAVQGAVGSLKAILIVPMDGYVVFKVSRLQVDGEGQIWYKFIIN